MTVKQLKNELEFFDDDMKIVFEVDDEFEPESITEDKWGHMTVRITSKLEPYFMCEIEGNMYIDLGAEKIEYTKKE